MVPVPLMCMLSAHLCCYLKRFLTVKELYHLFNQMIERQQWSQI